MFPPSQGESEEEIGDLRALRFLGRKHNNKPKSYDKFMSLDDENWWLYIPRVLCLKQEREPTGFGICIQIEFAYSVEYWI